MNGLVRFHSAHAIVCMCLVQLQSVGQKFLVLPSQSDTRPSMVSTERETHSHIILFSIHGAWLWEP